MRIIQQALLFDCARFFFFFFLYKYIIFTTTLFFFCIFFLFFQEGSMSMEIVPTYFGAMPMTL